MTTFMSPPPAATSLAFHPQDNNIIAIGMDDSSIQIFNVRVDEVFHKNIVSAYTVPLASSHNWGSLSVISTSCRSKASLKAILNVSPALLSQTHWMCWFHLVQMLRLTTFAHSFLCCNAFADTMHDFIVKILHEYNDISCMCWLILFCCHNLAMRVEFCRMGNAEVQILATATPEVAWGPIWNTSAIPSWPDSLSCHTRDSTSHIRNNQIRLRTSGKKKSQEGIDQENLLGDILFNCNLYCSLQWVPPESAAPISHATFSCDSQLVYASLVDATICIFNAAHLRLRCRISRSAYLPSSVR